jgi:hypothetical protein
MANGLYGKVSPPAGETTKATDTATPAGKTRAVVIGACNTTDQNAKISIAYSTAADAASVPALDWKALNTTLGPHGEYERTHQLLAPGENVFVKSDIAGINFDVRGYEGVA